MVHPEVKIGTLQVEAVRDTARVAEAKLEVTAADHIHHKDELLLTPEVVCLLLVLEDPVAVTELALRTIPKAANMEDLLAAEFPTQPVAIEINSMVGSSESESIFT